MFYATKRLDFLDSLFYIHDTKINVNRNYYYSIAYVRVNMFNSTLLYASNHNWMMTNFLVGM
jgi:hypothetical protein